MVATPKQLYDSAMGLNEKQRAELIGMLLGSLEIGTDEGVEAAWLQEIERRVAELDSGTAESVPWTEVRSRVFESRAR
jgi:putative addiction module component (TIGR02574 family)